VLNRAMIIGNLGGDPEMRYTQGGTAVANFSVATNEKWKDKDGNQQERVEWHRIVAFGRLAEVCGEHLTKGKQIYVEGRIQTRSWEDKDGQTRYATEIVASNMKMLGQKGNGSGGKGRPPAPPADEYEDDIPF